MYPIYTYGSDEQKDEWLPALGQGKAIGSFALTEPHGGSDPGAMNTIAEDKGDYWLINGDKRWVTSGSICDVFVLWAKTPSGVQGFLVPSKEDGLGFLKSKASSH